MKIKKYIVLFSAALLIASAIFSVGEYIKSSTPVVDIFCVSKTRSEEVVQSTGKIGYINQKTVRAGCDFIISDVIVKENDMVKKGDELFKAVVVTLPANIDMSSISELIDAYKNYDAGEVEYKTITATASGTVTSLKVKKGDIVKSGSELLTITDKSGLSVKLNINETQISKIKAGQRVTITGTAFDKVYIGSVLSIADEAEETVAETGRETTVAVDVKVEQPDKEIKRGYTAKCSIVVSSDNSSVVIPYEAIGSDSGGDYVYKFKNGRAEKKYVTVQSELSDGAKIKSGIESGDKIVKDISRLSDGSIQSVHIESGGEE